jgi:L-lactate dehydrogenase complex protein LldG
MAQTARREALMSTARDAILQSIRRGARPAQTIPAYALPPLANDLVSLFIAKAKASIADVHELAAVENVPAAVASILANTPNPRLHLPENSPLHRLPWSSAPGLMLAATPPSGEDSALSAADYAIAETGTLVFLSGPESPSSWHYRPGQEFVLLPRSAILARFEDVIALLAAGRTMPSTLNLVTGPSRTADIEQSIELGAHGPRALHILIVG